MKKYSVRPNVDADTRKTFGAFGDLESRLLYHRGMKNGAEASAFVSPDYDLHTHDPFLLMGMERSVERVYRAVKAGEKAVIYSDYDADGIPGGVILHDLFRKIGYTSFENYIPHRHNEGFGLNEEAIGGFAKSGAKLVITIDCGIADIAEAALAKSLGMDLIITDHHEPHEELPEAYAILNPKQPGCAYPEKMLCGSGVIFKFAQAFLKKHGAEFGVVPGWEKWLLDMVGIATLSDMVPLLGENRIFAHYGLKVLRKSPRPGLQKLLGNLRIDPAHLTEDDIGFMITPRINAASRMGEPMLAFRLLSTTDAAEAGMLAEELEHMNNERKGTVAALVKEIKKELSTRDVSARRTIVLGNPHWKPSLLGLVASKFAEEYGRPAFFWGRDGDGKIKGSCRSEGATSVFALMQSARDAFADFGGHEFSGGFTVRDEEIHFLADKLEEAAQKTEASILADESVDAELSLSDASWETYKVLERLAPYGEANPKPLFIFRKSPIVSVKEFGKEKNHTEITFSTDGGRKISAIGFFRKPSEYGRPIAPGAIVDVVAHIEKSVFRNYPELRLRLIDIL